MSQHQRDRAMDGFRTKQFDILVATDIAARGIDVEQVSHVVNFDMPNTPDAYTHRIGRTGRAGREGKAYTFVTADDHALVRALECRFGTAIPRRTVDVPYTIALTTGRPEPSRMGSVKDNHNRPSRARSQRSVKSHEHEADGANRDNNHRRRRSRGLSFSRTS